MHPAAPVRFTPYGWFVCAWVVTVSFQYGYHISTLNQIQAVLTCRGADSPVLHYGIPTCIPMSDATFSLLTSAYTIGGLVGSLSASLVIARLGRRGTVQYSSAFFVTGAGLMAISASLPPLLFGRLLCGVGAGTGLCVGPIFLNEIAPVAIRGSVGVLTQMAIVLGILVTQCLGLWLATPRDWRFVLLFSSFLSVAQLLVSGFVVETPVWLKKTGKLEALKAAEKKLWNITAPLISASVSADVEDPLLDDVEAADHDSHLEHAVAHNQAAVSISQLFTDRSLYRSPLIVTASAMISAQISGINAVLYYSNNILSRSLPELGPYVSLGITIVNALMTFPPIILIERWGRKKLLFTSIGGILVSLILVSWGLNSGLVVLSSVAIMTFVMSFAIGLGPIPFIIVPEVSPQHAVSALSSFGLSLNWIVNFCVGLVFLPLRNFLSGGDPAKEGYVFYFFVAGLSLSSLILYRNYHG
ncbi:general substrate transporter [Auriscalpium vulgare]|uniref:General substrate transporter n=1 Tax=Auriscalpium vulgare TaxID=40419 RepID=A0ACB8RVV5_9AGAM|nr:general substrate transporter [Auriscalpium vulgare]